MKVTRQSDLKESYLITCDWLKEFAESITKGANLEYLDADDRLKIKDSSARFRTIEGKMQDIKSRIGFDKLMSAREEELKTADNEIDGGVKTASNKFDPEHVKAMQSILDYIDAMVKNEPHSNEAAVVTRLREDTPLMDLPVDMGKLRKHISDLLSRNRQEPEVAYIPPEPVELSNIEDDQADYYRHSEVSTS